MKKKVYKSSGGNFHAKPYASTYMHQLKHLLKEKADKGALSIRLFLNGQKYWTIDFTWGSKGGLNFDIVLLGVLKGFDFLLVVFVLNFLA